MPPIVGISICGFTEERQFVTDTYVQAVCQSGGLPLILPALPLSEETLAPSALAPYLDRCDAFLLPGGGDFTPLLFDEAPTGQTGETSLTLDLFQLRLAAAILDTQKPVLGICRGMQLMNAALDGSLCQDLSRQDTSAFCHMQNTRNRGDVSHTVSVTPGCRLHDILGGSCYVNSYHHQGIGQPGRNVQICAHASDGTAEGIEVAGHPFALGVQWHPEAMLSTSPKMRNLFHCFIESV